MPTIDEQKEQEILATPLFLFECVFQSGVVERWSTHSVTIGALTYAARVHTHNALALQLSADEGLDASQKVSLSLANADSRFSQLERSVGFKGAKLQVQFLFYDLMANSPASEVRTIFRGNASPPDEITESILRVTFGSRLNLQRIVLPEVRIERRCPWSFPLDAAQRIEAVDGGAKGNYSPFYRCGYSADQTGGVGNLNAGQPFQSCDFTRSACETRGMFAIDELGHATRRFGGLEFVPAQAVVRGQGESTSQISTVFDNEARYNDFVPLVYGTAWYAPPIVFGWNDGGLTHFELLLGLGEIEDVIKVVVNGIEIPEGTTGRDMSATGWFEVVALGTRNGTFNPQLKDGQGNLLGDPYGSMATLAVTVPNQIANGQSSAKISVLMNGLKAARFDITGAPIGDAFTNNPAWVLLDVLRRSGWQLDEIDVSSFAAAAEFCGTLIRVDDLYGNPTMVPRFQCNCVIRNRRSAAEIVKGIRSGSMLMLAYGSDGRLKLRIENTLAQQQPSKPEGSNSIEPLNGGWPAYEFSDGSAPFSGICRLPSGEPSIRLWSRGGADVPNRLSVEFQDEFNEFQQDSLALVDVEDAILTSREITASFVAIGLPNFDQAARVLRMNLRKSGRGYTYVEFETSVRAVSILPGDLITITYLKEGLARQPFRVVKLVPGQNFGTVRITGQWHDDAWYSQNSSGSSGGRRKDGANGTLPRPLSGSVIDGYGVDQFGVTETIIEGASGSAVELGISFITPARPRFSAAAIPIVGLTPTVSAAGGLIAGGQTLYYAITATDADGAESPLSFIMRARIVGGSNTNRVQLTGLAFSAGTVGFNVYRGVNPSELLGIASGAPVAPAFTDNGLSQQLFVPNDPNFDHANVYWRRELLPEVSATSFSATTIGNGGLGLLVNEFSGTTVRIMRGVGSGQERIISLNSQTVLTITPPWTTLPDTTSHFTIVDSAWNFGAVGTSSPVKIQVPNRGGQTVQISGRSANALDQESQYELNPLTRWQIGSSGTGGIDSDVPPLPVFSLSLGGQGTIELTGISFPTLANTHTANTGTLTLYFWSELNGPPTLALASATSAVDTALTLSAPGSFTANTFIQIGSEILVITDVQNGGQDLLVERGAQESTAAGHSAGAPVRVLERSTEVVPFSEGFFGSPASQSYAHSIFLPDARIAAAEFYVTNSVGNSLVRHLSFGATNDGGLRTLSGGQVTLQVDGYLAVQTNATPPFVVEGTHAVRDIAAVLSEAPVGGSVQLRILQNTTSYATLTIPAGQTTSAAISGSDLPPLAAGARLRLDILSVPGAPNTLPGKSLTVTIRL